MNNTIIQITFILLLILLNGFFAAAEIAIVSLRKSRTNELIKSGNKKAIEIKHFQDNPEQFFATIQVGITLVTTLASAFGGAIFVEKLSTIISLINIPYIKPYIHIISFTIIVILISYFSLVLGELVPKSFALKYSEKVALFVSYPIKFFSIIFKYSIKFLTWSTNIVLKPFKDDVSFTESRLSEKELRYLIKEGCKAGTIDKTDEQLIENVFEFGDLEIEKIMTPHNKMIAIDIAKDTKEILDIVEQENYSRIPFYSGRLNNIIGILYTKDLIWKFKNNEKFKIRNILRPPLFVPATQKLNDVLQKFKENRTQIAIVLDEYGGVIGLVTLEDILEEIVGDIKDESDKISSDIEKQKDGSYIIEGSVPITDINKKLKTTIPENEPYDSISGFLLYKMHKFPKENEIYKYNNLTFKILKTSKKRILKIKIKIKKPTKLKKTKKSSPPTSSHTNIKNI